MNKRKLIAYIIKEERWLEFESITDATIYFKNLKLSLCNIHRVLTGESTQSKGLCFAYEDSDYVKEIIEKISRPIRYSKSHWRKVMVTDTYGNSETYESVNETSEYLGVSRTAVSLCAQGKRKNKDFTFKYV